MIVVEEGKTYRVTGTTGLFDYDKYTARTKFQWRVGDSSDPFRAGVYDQGEETRLPPTTGPERIVNLEAEELLEPKLGDNATYRIKRILYQAMKRNGGAVGNGSSITKPADGKTYRWYQALLIERASDGKACFVWTVYDDKDYIKLVEELSQPEAPPAVDVSVTIAAGKTTYIAAVVEGGAITKMDKRVEDGVSGGAGGGPGGGILVGDGGSGGSPSEPEEPKLNAALISFSPDMVVEYHQGTPTADLRAVGLTQTTDPSALIRAARPGFDRNDLEGKRYWPLGYRGWIIVGFTNGFPVGPGWMLQVFEGGKAGQWVDCWIAKELDRVRSVQYQSSAPTRGAYEFAFPYPSWRSVDCDDTNSFKRPTQPLGWDPSRKTNWKTGDPQTWVFAGSLKGVDGEEGKYPSPSEISLEDVPAGTYHYLLIHDSGKQMNGESDSRQPGADVYEARIVKGTSPPRQVYYHVALDASGSAQSQSSPDSLYYKTIRTLITQIANHNVGAGLYDKNLPVERYLQVRLISSTTSAPLQILGSIDYVKLEPATATAVADNVVKQWAFQGNTPLIEVLDATATAIVAKKNELGPAKNVHFFFVLLTDGIHDPDNRYPTQQGANNNQSAIVETIRTPVKAALIRVANLVKAGQSLVIGAWAADWVKTAYDALRRDDGTHIFKSVDIIDYKGEIHVDDPTVMANPTRIRHGEKFHTDCLGGDPAKHLRVGAGAAKLLPRDPNTGSNVVGSPYLTMPYEAGLTEELWQYSAVFDRSEPAIYRRKSKVGNVWLWTKDGATGDHVWSTATKRFEPR